MSPRRASAGGAPALVEPETETEASAAQVVDWSVASRVASWLSARRAVPATYDAVEIQRVFDQLVPQAEELVRECTGLRPPGSARAKVTDRPEWARLNVASFERLLAPALARLEERRRGLPILGMRPFVEAGRFASGTELGAVLAWMSGRVLGQYDVLLAEEGVQDQDVVYFVGPNVVQLEHRHGFPPGEFRLWLALHEVTHRAQFTGVPWLKGYFLSLVQEGLEPFVANPKALAEALRRAAEEVRAGRSPLEDAGMLGLVASEDQLVVIRKIQALMSLLEGHGDVTMDRAGAGVVPGAERFSKTLKERREQVRGPARLLQQILGIEAKMRQYADGERFIHAVEGEGGRELMDRVWRGPEWLPTMEEIRLPSSWVQRIEGMSAGA